MRFARLKRARELDRTDVGGTGSNELVRCHFVPRAVRRDKFNTQVFEFLKQSDVIRVGCPVQRDPNRFGCHLRTRNTRNEVQSDTITFCILFNIETLAREKRERENSRHESVYDKS